MRHDFFKGEVPLFITFWIFGIIPWVIYGLTGIILTRYYLYISSIPQIRFILYLYLIFPFLYFPAIYVAIWRSSMLYTKNRLWPIMAKLGVIAGTVFLLMGASIIIKQLVYRNDLTYQINEEIKLINKNLPMTIDGETDIEKVTFSNNVLSYQNKLIHKNSKDINSSFFSLLMKPKLIDMVCANKGLKSYLSKGITISYRYVDKHDVEISNLLIKASDCTR